jgi:pimeloyl-ACP methyl ester carboxylesterase
MPVGLPETRYARSSGGVHIAYQVHGSGPMDLAFLAGPVQHVEAIWDWPAARRLLERLGFFTRVIRFDRRGTGLSDPFGSAPTLEQFADDLDGVLDATETERCALLATSEACRTAVLYAATRPERVTALALLGASTRGTDAVTDEVHDAILDGIENAWGTPALLPIFAPSLVGSAPFEEFWSRYTRAACSPGMARSLLDLAIRTDVTEILPALRVPTLVLHRNSDTLVPVEQGRALAEAIEGARFVELEGVDSVVFAGDVDAVGDEIEEFLATAPPATGPARKLGTILYCELVGGAERAERLGEERWRELLDDWGELVRREVTRFRGDELPLEVDGLLATFDGPSRAIACARVLLQRVRVLGLELRAGLHAGELEANRDGWDGAAITCAARIATRAAGGEVLASGTVRDLVVGSGIEFEDRGAHELEGVEGTWALAAVIA